MHQICVCTLYTSQNWFAAWITSFIIFLPEMISSTSLTLLSSILLLSSPLCDMKITLHFVAMNLDLRHIYSTCAIRNSRIVPKSRSISSVGNTEKKIRNEIDSEKERKRNRKDLTSSKYGIAKINFLFKMSASKQRNIELVDSIAHWAISSSSI